VDQELGEIGLKKRVVPAFANLNPREYEENFWYVSKTPELLLNEPNGKKILWQLVEETQPEVLILDPLGQIHGFNENDNTEIGELFTILDQLKSDFSRIGLSLVIAHHFGKPLRGRDAADYDTLDPQNFRGSSRFFGNPDSIVTMERTKNLVSSHTAWGLKARFILRHGEEIPDMNLTVNENKDGLVRFKNYASEGPVKLPSFKLPGAPVSNGSEGRPPKGFLAI
jgi:hypothetical protein